jgi:hypothetical protein
MDADKLEFLDDEPETEVTAETPPEPEKTEEQPEVEAEPEQVEGKGEKEAAPPAVLDEKQPGHVPLAALLDEREKRQRIEREAEELRRWRQQVEAQQQKKPDFFENPDEALSQFQRQLQQQQMADNLRQSRFYAEREYGADLVKEAYEWFDQHPDQSQALLKEPSPFHAAVETYKRQKLLQEVGPDPDGWRKKQEEALRQQIRAEVEAEYAQKAPTRPAAPPRSLASAPSAGGNSEPVPDPFDDMFGGRA